MKLLPHAFKWIGLAVFIIGFAFSAVDDGRRGFMDGWSLKGYHSDAEFVRILPKEVSQIADYVLLTGLLIYILSKEKREDEFAQKMRFETAFIVLVMSIVLLLIVYMTIPDLRIEPSTLIGGQMVLYLIIRAIRRSVILDS